MKKILAIAVVIVLLGLSVYAQSADDIIKSYLKASQLEKTKEIKTMNIMGKMTRQGMDMQLKILLKRPNKVWTEITAGPQKMTQGYDGATAWAITPQSGSLEPQVLSGLDAQNLKDQFEILDDPFMNYKEKGSEISLISREEKDGKSYYRIELKKKNGDVTTNYFDTETCIIKKIALKRSNMGQEVFLEFVFDDYKPVGGVMFAHKITTLINGNSIGDIIFTSITINTEIDDSLFPIPKIQH